MTKMLCFFAISALFVFKSPVLASPAAARNLLDNFSNEKNIPGNLWIPNLRFESYLLITRESNIVTSKILIIAYDINYLISSRENGNQPASYNNQLNLALNRYKIGDIVAEIEVSGGNIDSSEDNSLEDRVDVGTFPEYELDNTFSNTEPPNRRNDYERCKDPASKITLYHKDNFEWSPQSRTQRPLILSTEVYQLGRFDGKERGQQYSSPFMSVEIKGKCCWETFSESDYRGKMLRLCRGKYNSSTLGRMAGNIKSLRPVKHFN